MTEQSEGERLYILGHPVAHSKSRYMKGWVCLGPMPLPITPSWTRPAPFWMRGIFCP